MLQRLLRAFGRKTPAEPDPQRRAAAVAGIGTGAGSQAQLLAVVRSDADARVRDAALARIDDGDALLPLAGDARVLARLATLAESAADATVARWLADPEVALGIACATRQLALGERILGGLDDEAAMTLATRAHLPALRRLAAQRPRSEAALAELERRSRTDKAVNRLARERLEARRSLAADLATTAERLAHLDARATQLERAQHDGLLAAKADHLADAVGAERAGFAALHARATAFADIEVPGTFAEQATRIAARVAIVQQRAEERQRAAAAAASELAASDAATSDTGARTAGMLPATASPAPAQSSEQAASAASGVASAGTINASAGAAAAVVHETPPPPQHAGLGTAEDPAEVQAAALAAVRALADRLRSADAVDAALAELPAALQHHEARWLAACDRHAPARADADAMRALVHNLKALAAAARRLDAAADQVARIDGRIADTVAPDAGGDWLPLYEREQRQARTLELADDLLQRVDWPTAFAPASALRRLAAARARGVALHEMVQAEHARATSALSAALAALEAAIAAGSLNAARARQAEARRALRALPARSVRADSARFAALSAQVADMRAWHDFATEPKRAALCAEMESLAAVAAGMSAVVAAGSSVDDEAANDVAAAGETDSVVQAAAVQGAVASAGVDLDAASATRATASTGGNGDAAGTPADALPDAPRDAAGAATGGGVAGAPSEAARAEAAPADGDVRRTAQDVRRTAQDVRRTAQDVHRTAQDVRQPAEGAADPAHRATPQDAAAHDAGTHDGSPQHAAAHDTAAFDAAATPADEARPRDIPQLAERIKGLRARWSALGPIVSAAERALADRFEDAADRAFAPCRAWFEARAGERREHLAERTRICDQLEQYLAQNDWTHADWRGAQQILRTARSAFLGAGSVDRAAGREIGRRFDALASRLHALIKSEMDRNIAARRALVAEAEALATSDAPVEQRTAAVKVLQQRWRDVGIVPRRLDQALWAAFRAPCDAVFGARTARQEAERQAIAADSEAADRICDGIEARLATGEPIDGTAELARQRAALEALRLPRDVERRVFARLRELESTWQQRVRDRARQREADRLLGVLRLHDRIAALETAGSIDVDADFAAREAAGDDALAFAIDARIAAARGTRSVAASAALDARRRLTVATEILAGVDSPADDQQLRLQAQLSRLNASLANRTRERADIDALLRDWLAAGAAADDAATAALRERMEKAVRAYLD